MSDLALPVEAEIVHDIPDELALAIGKLMAIHAKLEHKLTMLSALLLQLSKAEARIVLREPRTVDRLDMALDLFAIKDIQVTVDTIALRSALQQISTERDRVAHGVWLQHPATGEIFLRIARGNWPKDMTRGAKVKRAVFPQSSPYRVTECQNTIQQSEDALRTIDELGAVLDDALLSSPEKFRPPSPVLNPLGHRRQKVT